VILQNEVLRRNERQRSAKSPTAACGGNAQIKKTAPAIKAEAA